MDSSASNEHQTESNHVQEEGRSLALCNTGITDLLSKISALIKQRCHEEALKECEEALGKHPGNEKLLEKKIKIYCQLGQFQKAHGLAQEWTKSDPENPVAAKELNRLKIVLRALEDQDSDEESPNDEETAAGGEQATAVQELGKSNPPAGQEESPPSCSPPAVTATMPANSSPQPPTPPPCQETQQTNKDTLVFECSFCEIKFKRQEELETHCRSDLHKKRLTSDDGQEWKYRAPPRGLSSDEYSLCIKFCETKKCPYGDKCTRAHSEDELKEWRERFVFRRQQLEKARERQLHGNSYTEQLLEKLMSSDGPKAVLVQSLDFVKVHVNSDLKVNMTSKKCTNAWTFTITSKLCLHSVALIDDVNRSYFHISSISVGPKKTQKYQNLENQCQEWINQDTAGKGHGEYVYRIKVVFKTDIYGTFRQSIVYDFGLEAVLTREMQVESAPVLDTEKLTKDLILTDANHWTEEKVKIISFCPSPLNRSEEEKNLLAKYTLPHPEKFSMSDTIMQSLSKDNYRLWMHEMLYLEEMAQIGHISRFNIEASLGLVDRFLLIPGALSTAKFAQNGELFAEMKLNDDLSEDSTGGRLILMSAQLAWLAPCDTKSEGKMDFPEKVYEAVVEDKGKNFIFLRLSAQCVSDLGLKTDENLHAQVQFQLNRLPMCEMHAAVDQLQTLDIVFPKLNNIPSIPSPSDREWKEEEETKLNAKQREAIVGITADMELRLPPLLIVGPFGTGKTYTLAQAAKGALEQDGSRILICTHSNSAADLYIREFFHPLVESGHEDARPLRVYYRFRWMQTVSDTVLQYCLRAESRYSSGSFRNPTLEDLEKHRVIVTTLSTARYISDLNLPRGFFTHIFVDEAAQALECETLIPLSMAGEDTRIVLAGDYMQLSPEVYSSFTQQQGFQISLLERLHDMYPSEIPCRIMLCENYRSHSTIIDFTSELFYDNKLIASGQQKPHVGYYPLTFFTARGEEVQHQNSTGFYNNSEVYEIAEIVDEMQKKWPDNWGKISENGVGIVAPYSDQVIRIRAEMRKRKMQHVSVERVLNVQGKQYRVIILSTVRTRHTCRSDSSEEDLMDYGFLSNVKLLNTAITRAQSLVVVVGDPVSLCLVGKCRKVWEHFLEICSEHGSLWGTTWAQLRSQLDGAEMTKTYILNPLAPEFVPNRLFHNIRGSSDPTSGVQGVPLQPFTSPQQMAAFSSAHYQHMYPPFLPYYPMPYYHPHNDYHGLLLYRPFGHQRHGAFSPNRAASPKMSPPRVAAPTLPSMGAGHKARSEAAKAMGEIRPSAAKGFHKMSKNRMMLYWPHMPVSYPPYHHMYPHPGYYYLPDDPRHYHYQQMMMQPGWHHRHMYPSYGYHHHHDRGYPPHYSGMPGSAAYGDRRDSSDTGSPGSSNASVSGQQIQLLPNVKHIPAHLLNQPGDKSGNSSRSSTPVNQAFVPSQTTEGHSEDVTEQPAATLPEQHESPVPERRGTPISERPYSPANYGVGKIGSAANRDKTEFSNRNVSRPFTEKEKLSANEKLNNRRGPKTLTLKTGFSRQFSDDLPTPTEVTNVVRMIEEIEEKVPSVEAIERSPEEGINGKTQAVPLTKLKLNLARQQQIAEAMASSTDSNESSVLPNGEKLSYAGVLRKQSSPTSTSPQIGDTLAHIEPQTPRTPSGFITPGADVDMDPLGILKSLNIETPPQSERDFQHFP